MTQILRSAGPDSNAYSQYATSNSISHGVKLPRDKQGHNPSYTTAFRSNFQRFPQGGGTHSDVMCTMSNDFSRKQKSILDRDNKVGIHELMTRRDNGGVSGFACNFGPTLLSQARIHPACGGDADRGVARTKRKPTAPWQERTDIVARRHVGGSQMNQPARELYLRLHDEPMISEVHASGAVVGELPLIPCSSNRHDLAAQRSGTLEFGDVHRGTEFVTTMHSSFLPTRPPREELRKNQFAASRSAVAGPAAVKQTSGWGVNTSGFVCNQEGARAKLEAANNAEAQLRRSRHTGSDEDRTFVSTAQQDFARPEIAVQRAHHELRKTKTSYATSRERRTFLPVPAGKNRISTTPPLGITANIC